MKSKFAVSVFLLGTLFIAIPQGFALPTKKSHAQNPKSLELNEKGVQAVTSKNFSLAEDLFKKAIAEDPGNLTAVYNLSGIYITNQKEQEAISLLTDYVKRHEKDPGLYARLGDAYFGAKNIASAEESYRKALALAPKYPDLNARLATIYTLQSNTRMAEEYLTKAAAAKPKDGQLLANLAAVLLANKKPQEAVATAKRALRLKSTSEIYITLGNSYESLKDYKNSLISFERARDLGSKSEGLSAKITDLKKLAS